MTTSIIRYAAVYSAGNLLIEYPIAEQPVLAKNMSAVVGTVPPKEYRRQTVEDTDANYHYLSTGDNTIFACVTTKSTPTRITFAFIESIESSYKAYLSNGFIKEECKKMARTTLEQKVAFYNDPANDKISNINESLVRAQNTMTENIEKTLERGDKLDTMHATSIALASQAGQFNKRSGELKRQMMWRHIKMILMVVGGAFVIILILLMIICKPNFSAC